jgi:hypothetical protein
MPPLETLRSVLEPTGIIAGLFFTAWSSWRAHCSQQVATLVAITKSHREIWQRLYEAPELRRVSDSSTRDEGLVVTPEERLFTLLLTLHAYTSFEASRLRVMKRPPREDRDLAALFSAPVARRVWETLREFQDPRFRDYIDSLIEARRAPLNPV